MFLDAGHDHRTEDHWNSKSLIEESATPVASLVSRDQRATAYNHKPLTILISGLSGSGKTTLAQRLEKALFEVNQKTVLLDGQTMRSGLSRDLGFSAEERSENLRRAAEVAKLLNDSGLVCIASFIAPHEDVREKARQLIGVENFFHIHLSTPLEVCRRRDQSGIYAAAERGEISRLPGVGSDFETPSNPDLVVSTEQATIDEIVAQVLRQLQRQ
jgi:bifunctional enzyme CysN/CysC